MEPSFEACSIWGHRVYYIQYRVALDDVQERSDPRPIGDATRAVLLDCSAEKGFEGLVRWIKAYAPDDRS